MTNHAIEATADDAAAELSRVEALEDAPAATLADLEQNPPELGYYEAELKSLRAASETERP